MIVSVDYQELSIRKVFDFTHRSIDRNEIEAIFAAYRISPF
jgi:hypothetical protein